MERQPAAHFLCILGVTSVSVSEILVSAYVIEKALGRWSGSAHRHSCSCLLGDLEATCLRRRQGIGEGKAVVLFAHLTILAAVLMQIYMHIVEGVLAVSPATSPNAQSAAVGWKGRCRWPRLRVWARLALNGTYRMM